MESSFPHAQALIRLRCLAFGPFANAPAGLRLQAEREFRRLIEVARVAGFENGKSLVSAARRGKAPSKVQRWTMDAAQHLPPDALDRFPWPERTDHPGTAVQDAPCPEADSDHDDCAQDLPTEEGAAIMSMVGALTRSAEWNIEPKIPPATPGSRRRVIPVISDAVWAQCPPCFTHRWWVEWLEIALAQNTDDKAARARAAVGLPPIPCGDCAPVYEQEMAIAGRCTRLYLKSLKHLDPNLRPMTQLETLARAIDPQLANYLHTLGASASAVEAVQQFAADRIEYRSEAPGLDVWQSPTQTIRDGHGDCEDLAVLKFGLLRLAGFEADDLSLVYGRRAGVAHVMLTVQVDGASMTLDVDRATPTEDALPLEVLAYTRGTESAYEWGEWSDEAEALWRSKVDGALGGMG